MKNFKRIDDQVGKNTKKITSLELDTKRIDVLERNVNDINLKADNIDGTVKKNFEGEVHK